LGIPNRSSVIRHLLQPHSDPAEAPPLVLRFGDHDRPDLPRLANVCAAIGLPVQADDVDHSDLFDELREKVHLGPDQARVFIGRVTREERDLYRPVLRQFIVEFSLDNGEILRGPVGNVEVEPPLPRSHIPSRYGRMEPIPYHPTQRM
jgi:hypothetical protein